MVVPQLLRRHPYAVHRRRIALQFSLRIDDANLHRFPRFPPRTGSSVDTYAGAAHRFVEFRGDLRSMVLRPQTRHK